MADSLAGVWAFPVPPASQTPGMSMLDYASVAALQGLLAGYTAHGGQPPTNEAAAGWAVDFGEALCAELQARKGKPKS
jgi:hypothetical protein